MSWLKDKLERQWAKSAARAAGPAASMRCMALGLEFGAIRLCSASDGYKDLVGNEASEGAAWSTIMQQQWRALLDACKSLVASPPDVLSESGNAVKLLESRALEFAAAELQARAKNDKPPRVILTRFLSACVYAGKAVLEAEKEGSRHETS